MSAGEKALSGEYETISVYTFDPLKEDKILEWQKRPYHNRGKIMIGNKAIDDDRLDEYNNEKVPAGERVRVFEMTIKFSSEENTSR